MDKPSHSKYAEPPRSAQQAFERLKMYLNTENKLNRESGNKQGSLEAMKNHIVFERVLSRLSKAETSDYNWAIKGGHLMNLRFPLMSRATKDIDIAMWNLGKNSSYDDVLDALKRDLVQVDDDRHDADFFSFKVLPQKKNNILQKSDGTKTASFHIEAWLGRKKVTSFHMDIGIDDIPFGIESYTNKTSYSEFMDYAESVFPAITIEQHIAEKIHAYTRPYERYENMRYKDLYDLVVLIDGTVNTESYKESMDHVFRLWGTHEFTGFETPSESWKEPFEKMSKRAGLDITLDEAYQYVQSFINDGVKMDLDEMRNHESEMSL